MPTLKKFPWFSLALLLATCSILGWILSDLRHPKHAWAIVGVSILLLNALLAASWAKIRNGIAKVFRSDTKTFFVTVIAAFLSVVVIAWLRVFVPALIVILTGIIFKLDAQTAKLSETQTFWILSIVSLTGLGFGGFVQTLSYFNP